MKQIHELILSPHNINLFEREMNIASKCRHPHLLQFIGATKDKGTPLFVTELMEKGVRTLLEQRQLSETEIAVISLDVARALNYLHRKNYRTERITGNAFRFSLTSDLQIKNGFFHWVKSQLGYTTESACS